MCYAHAGKHVLRDAALGVGLPEGATAVDIPRVLIKAEAEVLLAARKSGNLVAELSLNFGLSTLDVELQVMGMKQVAFMNNLF